MVTESIIAGLMVGFLGSFHCVGMCGPLALSLPIADFSPVKRYSAAILYNTGRIFTYAMLGLIFGIAGRNIQLAGFQQVFSIISGIILLVIAARLFLHKHQTATLPFMRKFQGKVMKFMQFAMQQKSVQGIGLLGIANGLLPCGMVYLAVAGALNTGSTGSSVLFMAMFGLGTFPAMLVLSLAGYRINISMRNKIKTLVPYVVSVMGILLLLRGMNLGIPFISPELYSGTATDPVICH